MTSPVASSYQYIDSNIELNRLLDLLQQADRIALDTEADSLHHYYAKVCLIQLTIEEDNFIIDPLADMDVSRLTGVLSEKPLVLHGIDYDLRMMRNSFGFRPKRPVFDTMLAAQYLGLDAFGYAALVQQYFNVTLSNLGKKSNWSKRPLTETQLQYACDDTFYLEPLAHRLEKELIRHNRLEWHREACQRAVEASRVDKPKDKDKLWRIKGVRFLSRRQMAFLRDIWCWREKEAQRADLPPFKIMRNQQLIEMVQWVTSRENCSLEGFNRLPKNCKGHRLRHLEKAIQKADSLPESQWPERKKSTFSPPPQPNRKSLIEALMVECTAMAQKIGISPSVLATRSALTAIAHHLPGSVEELNQCCSLMHWQAEMLFPVVHKVIQSAGGN